MIINVKNSPGVSLPVKATEKSSAYDVIAISEPEIVGSQHPDVDDGWKSIDYIQYRTGLLTAPQSDSYGGNYHILIHPRSSVSKYNLVLANGIGLVDNDYRNEILVRYKYIWQPEDLSWNAPYSGSPVWGMVGKVNMDKIYKKGDKVAQLVSEVTTDVEWVIVENLDVTTRTGGFGSTDVWKQKEQISNMFHSAGIAATSSFIPIKAVPGAAKSSPPPKEYESHVDLIDQWKKAGGTVGPSVMTYEKMIKEREKTLGTPS